MRVHMFWNHRRTVFASGAVVIAGVMVVGWALTRSHEPSRVPLSLERVGVLDLPGSSSRFDYASLDIGRGLLFVAHLGDGEVVEVDVRAGRVVRTISGLPEVHGVLVVPTLHRVYATATDENQMTTLDEDTGAVFRHSPTGDYPDGLAYDPTHGTVWTTNERGGSETVIDAASGSVRGTVRLGGEVGNVAYDPGSGQILVDVQTRDQLAVIDPVTLTVTRRVGLPGCDHDHGLALAPRERLAFVACDGNAQLLAVDLATWQVTGRYDVGEDPDVLAYDRSGHDLYIAAESGWLTVVDDRDRHLTVVGRDRLADGAHVVAVDPSTHRTYYPLPRGGRGGPALLTLGPTP